MVRKRRTPLPGAGVSEQRSIQGCIQNAVPHTSAGVSEQLSIQGCTRNAVPATGAGVSEQLSIQRSTQNAVSSSCKVMLPRRPGHGTVGKKCVVRANHFLAQITTSKDFHHYNVSIKPKVASVNREVMRKLESHFGGHLPVYDGANNLFTAGPLPFESKDFDIALTDEDRSGRGDKKYKVKIKLAARVNPLQLELFLKGRRDDAPQEVLQVLALVLRESAVRAGYFAVSRSIFSPELGEKHPLSEGLECLSGFYQTFRPTQMGLSLNIDMSTTAFIEALPVVDFIRKLLNRDIPSGPLSNENRAKINQALRGVQVEVTHRANLRRKYRISGLTSQTTDELTFRVDGGSTTQSIIQYFRGTHSYDIKHTQLPCLQVGNPKRPNYLPMEVCKIVEGQRPHRLNGGQMTNLYRVASLPPKERENNIVKAFNDGRYNRDRYEKEFGIEIDTRLRQVDARVLPAPQLKYHDSGRIRVCRPKVGCWDMRDKRMVNGGQVNHWFCINFMQSVSVDAANKFCFDLARTCNTLGMEFNQKPILPVTTGLPQNVEEVLRSSYHKAMDELGPRGKSVELLIVILPDSMSPLYGNIKRICETGLGLVSQCCLARSIRKGGDCLVSLALKINVKVGGRNTVLIDAMDGRLPVVSKVPTIVFGADVTHWEGSSPSIAAVVASQDWPEITKYACLVRAQAHHLEIIQDLYKPRKDPREGTVDSGMIGELLRSFRKETGHIPQRIIFYRDGVNEGEFQQVLSHELDAIHKACLHLGIKTSVTFVVVQKRHHTRLFADKHWDKETVDNRGNILPGTVVDTDICHPTEFDFYLCSHAGFKGTNRPAHYHVLWDENGFSADDMQSLTNDLCYTYAKCTRAVSIVPPVYYAHLAAYRARHYVGREMRRRGPAAAGAAAEPLLAIKENMKRVMFYV